MYGLTKNQGGLPVALLAPYNFSTFGWRRPFQTLISRMNKSDGVTSESTFTATVRPSHLPWKTSEKKPIPILGPRWISNLSAGNEKNHRASRGDVRTHGVIVQYGRSTAAQSLI